jgi:competence protein ComEA
VLAVVTEWPASLQLAVVLGVVAAVALLSYAGLSERESAPPELSMPRASSPPEPVPAGPTSSAAPESALVHAAGAVTRPGVYELPSGSRVDDVLSAAGGATADADLDRLNLAAVVNDGERIWVPRRGEVEPPPVSAAAGAGTARPEGNGPGAETSGPLDLNTATSEELDTLPGVGPATAEAIIAHREANGPFTSVDQLIDVRGIGEAKLAQLRDLVHV